jgi:hypothetical protein
MIEVLTEFTVSGQLHDVIACPPLAAVGCNDRAGRGDPPPRLATEIRRGLEDSPPENKSRRSIP